jgi:lipopolysaccharide export system protein LptA
MGKGEIKITFAKVMALSRMSKHHLQFIFIALFMGLSFFAKAQTQIEFLGADYGDYDETQFGKVNRLIGNVRFKHEDVTMFCDSAYLYKETNSFEAFNNVRIYQGDSVSLFGDTMYYNGNTRHALMKGKVVTLSDNEMTLTTDIVNYDAPTGIGYYTTGGHIVNKENNMVSREGNYDTKAKTFIFKDSIILTNPEYVMYSDTLHYNTETRFAYFFGPTRIINIKDSTIVYCENGWYNTKINYSQINKNAYIFTEDKKLFADSMVYTGKTAVDEAFGNIYLVDTTNKIEIRGQRGTYNRNTNKAWITQAPMAAMQAENDTLFVTADTLLTTYDTLTKNRTLYTYHKTKFFKKDLQGTCDSLQYSFKDSVINMEVNPIVWSDNNQITADTLRVYMKDGQMSSIKMLKNVFIAMQRDSLKYNQVKGRNAQAYFANKKLRVVTVNQDVENVYYVEEDTGKYIGMQRVICGSLRIVVDSNKVTEVHYQLSPTGVLHPMDKIPAGEDRLKGFAWLDAQRPKSKEDITPVYIAPKAPEKTAPAKEEKKKDTKNKPKNTKK